MFANAARNLVSPLLSLVSLTLAVGYFLSFTSLRMRVEGHSPAVIGLLGSCYFLGFFLGAFKVEKFVSRVKHIQAFAFFAAINAISVLMQGLAISVYPWLLFRFLNGFSVAALMVVIQSWFLVVSPDRYRGRVLALFMLALYVGSAFSQFFNQLYDVWSLQPYILGGLLAALSIVPVTLTKTSVPELHEPSAGIFLKLIKISPLGVGGSVAGGMMVSSILSLLPVYALEQNLPVSFLLFVAVGCGGLFQWPVGYFSDKYDRRKVLIVVSLFISLFAFFMTLYVENPLPIFVLTGLISGFCFTIYPMSITQACDRLSSNHLMGATGALMLCYGFGAILGPLIAPFFMKMLPPSGIFAYLGATGILVSGMALFSLLSRKAVREEEKTPFIPIAGTIPVASELDPRN